MAGGIGLEAFVPRLAVPGLRQVLSVCLVLLGTAVSAGATRVTTASVVLLGLASVALVVAR